jgi:hypothetical protein
MSAAAQEAQGADSDPRLLRALGELKSLLVPGESLEVYAVQRRLFALIHRRALVGATSGRLIGMTRGLLGGFHPTTVRWQDLKEARVSVGIFGASLTITYFFTSPDLAIGGTVGSMIFTGLRKAEAQEVYRLCQAQDQAWREKRRVRELEELRAKSGGIHLGPQGSPLASTQSLVGEQEDPVARLQRAKTMLEKGLISDSEYETLKARIVNVL